MGFVYFISLADKVTDDRTFLMFFLELSGTLRPHFSQACFCHTVALDLISSVMTTLFST